MATEQHRRIRARRDNSQPLQPMEGAEESERLLIGRLDECLEQAGPAALHPRRRDLHQREVLGEERLAEAPADGEQRHHHQEPRRAQDRPGEGLCR